MDHQQALEVVYSALDLINALRSQEDVIALAPDVVLSGEDGVLDSLALTTLILSIENRVQDLTGQEVSLIGEGDMESELEAFRTPTTLAQAILKKLGHD